MKVEVDWYEYDCGSACTPNGCTGHESDVPETVWINGIPLTLKGFADWPFATETEPDGYDLGVWKKTVAELLELSEKQPPMLAATVPREVVDGVLAKRLLEDTGAV